MHVIGTAGHVDHGKSTLVQALTGIDPDRLAEEKAREMTIDLGFAWLELDGQEVGIVDVPGHRDFIENMLAGVGGIDLALFVIAADEGVMPQTREHLAILDLLEVNHAVIALTKSDLVDDPDWLELVLLEVNDAMQGTALAGAPIIPVSARTGAGISNLRAALSQALQQIGEPMDWGRPRLPIDRVFSLPGFGTIVTGTLLDGSLRVGDEIEVVPGGRAGRIRGLQTHKTKRDVALPGSRVAINLTGIDKDDLGRGQVVVHKVVVHKVVGHKVVGRKGQLRPTRLLDVLYRHLPDADAPLTHNATVKLFAGSAEVSARARIIAAEEIAPGQEGFVQFALAAPVAAVRGERFIVRRPSPGSTLGGGRVLDASPGRRHRRFRDDVAQRFRTLAQGSPLELLMATLIRLGPLPPATLLEKAGLNADEGMGHLTKLIEQAEIVDLGKVVIAAATWNGLKERAPREVGQYHQEFPMRPGMQREALRGRLQIAPAVFNPLREGLAREGAIVESDTLLKLPDHEVRFTDAQEQAIARLMNAFREQGILSPSVKEAKALVGEETYFALVDLGRIKPVNDEVVYAAELYDQLIRQLSDYLHEKGSLSAPEARDLLGASRKYAIALLEHMDELRITRRSGDLRLPARPFSPGVFTET